MTFLTSCTSWTPEEFLFSGILVHGILVTAELDLTLEGDLNAGCGGYGNHVAGELDYGLGVELEGGGGSNLRVVKI